jgi:hypothetical protein
MASSKVLGEETVKGGGEDKKKSGEDDIRYFHMDKSSDEPTRGP